MVPDLIVLAFDYYRDPLRFSHLTDPERPLPDIFENLVGAFGNALSPRNIEATAEALGERPAELELASRFFLRQVLLSPRSNHYRALGLPSNASDEAIRQHYQLLVRIFHPDRSIGDSARDAAYTARINEAYSVLKNPVSRQRYDRHLTSAPGRGATESASCEPPGPSDSIGSYSVSNESRAKIHTHRQRTTAILAWGGGMLAAVGALAIFLADRQPVLRTNPELVDRSVAPPSFLEAPPSGSINPLGPRLVQTSPGDRINGDAAKPQPEPSSGKVIATESASLAQLDRSHHQEVPPPSVSSTEPAAVPAEIGVPAEEQLPGIALLPAYSETTKPAGPNVSDGKAARASGASDRRAQRRKAKVSPEKKQGRDDEPIAARSKPASEAPTRPKAHPEDLIKRLTHYYQTGDLDDFVGLFAANARVNNGSGIGFIRRDYAELFSRTMGRRLSISDLRWRSKKKGEAEGLGKYRVGVKDSRSGEWRSATGELVIVIIRGKSGYKISKMIYR